jgi:uncharacterized protein (TIGR02186 family)
LSIAVTDAQTHVELVLEPAGAEIGIFYSGVEFVAAAEMDPGLEMALLVIGPSTDLDMRKSEHVWGLFWAPTTDVSFEGIPSLYILRSSTELAKLASRSTLNEIGIGYETLPRPLEEGEGDVVVEELVRLKESEGLFSLAEDGTDFESSPGKPNRTAVKVHLPAHAPANVYSVRLFGFRDGRLVSQGEGDFELRQATTIAFVRSLALNHGLFYGFLAVVVALAAGLGVGFLYGSSGKH